MWKYKLSLTNYSIDSKKEGQNETRPAMFPGVVYRFTVS